MELALGGGRGRRWRAVKSEGAVGWALAAAAASAGVRGVRDREEGGAARVGEWRGGGGGWSGERGGGRSGAARGRSSREARRRGTAREAVEDLEDRAVDGQTHSRARQTHLSLRSFLIVVDFMKKKSTINPPRSTSGVARPRVYHAWRKN